MDKYLIALANHEIPFTTPAPTPKILSVCSNFWLFYISFGNMVAAVLCSCVSYRCGGVDPCIFVTGKPHRAWHRCMASVHGAGWVGGGVALLSFELYTLKG